MYQYPGQYGVNPNMMSSGYNPVGVQAQQSPVFGPQLSPAVPQVPGQGVYPPSTQIPMKVRPVASYDEAKAVPTDFMGNMLILTDLSHGMIYTKVLDPATGSSVFKAYQLIPEQGPQMAPMSVSEQKPEYDAKSEIEKIRMELSHLKQELGIEEEKV